MRESGKIVLPERIRSLTAGEPYQTDDIGMSGSMVLLYQDKVLKIQQHDQEAENEYRMMKYLQDKLPVPAVHACEVEEGRSYLLMDRCAGQMACSDVYLENPAVLCGLLADGLRRLWRVDITDCPSDQRLSYKLAQAAYRVENDLVDLDNVDPGTFGAGGFKDPAALLQWLYDNKPEEEPVLSHGDMCLPNLFGIQDRTVGYIDLGRSGIADKWCDIALCCRSLSDNFTGCYSGGSSHSYNSSLLFQELGIIPDQDKIRYYILLDELF